MVVREWPVTRAGADILTPSTRRLATWSNSRRLQRRPRYAVPVFVLSVPPQTVQRYPPAAARRRHKPAVAHDVEAGLSKVVAPRLAARPLVDRIHRPSVTARRINSDRHKHPESPVGYGLDRPTSPLRSIAITALHHDSERLRPSASHRYSGSCGVAT